MDLAQNLQVAAIRRACPFLAAIATDKVAWMIH
jgi:hypothetical protein